MNTILKQPVLSRLNILDSDMREYIAMLMEIMISEGGTIDSDELYAYVCDSDYCGMQSDNTCNCLESSCDICSEWMEWADVATQNLTTIIEGFYHYDNVVEMGNPCAVKLISGDTIVISHDVIDGTGRNPWGG